MNSPDSTIERPLTGAQLRKIWAAAREVALTEEALREHLERLVGKRSLRELTREEGKLVIDFLVDGLGASGHGRDFVPSRRANQDPGRTPPLRAVGDNLVRIVTTEQLTKIGYLLRDLGLSRDSSKFLTVVALATGKSMIRTARDASKVIDGLTAIAKRQVDHGGEPGPAA